MPSKTKTETIDEIKPEKVKKPKKPKKSKDKNKNKDDKSHSKSRLKQVDSEGVDALNLVLSFLNQAELEEEFIEPAMILKNPIISSMIKAEEILEKTAIKPDTRESIVLTKEVLAFLKEHGSNQAVELHNLLGAIHFQALFMSHDDVGQGNYDLPTILPEEIDGNSEAGNAMMNPGWLENVVRMVGIKKLPNEPLGMTVRVQNNELVIARIIGDGPIDRQGLLSVGDMIKEVNGRDVKSPKELQDAVKQTEGDNIMMKIVSNYESHKPMERIFVKAMFSFDAKSDMLIPCREAGLKFQDGDILEILNKDDRNWWQAKLLGTDLTGLVPSQDLQERRKAWVRPEWDYTKSSIACGLVKKKKRKVMYTSNKASTFDKCEFSIYEPVCSMPPFSRNVLALVGAQGLGQRTLIHRLMREDTEQRFGTTMPHTSRPPGDSPEEQRGYHFTSREEMELDIAADKYLEWGEYMDELYGTKLDSVKEVIATGRMCLLDVLPQTVKKLKTAEFAPFVVMVAAPTAEILDSIQWDLGSVINEEDCTRIVNESMNIEKTYKQYFDLILVNENMEQCFALLFDAINQLATEAQWVPLSWVY